MDELIIALQQDNLAKIKSLCKKGIDLKEPITIGLEYDLEDYDQVSVLFYAIRYQASIEAIELLLECGADIYEIDEDGLSAIDIAIKFKREDVVKLCIEKGMDVNKTSRKSKINPLLLASCFNNVDIVKLLLDNGADINYIDNYGMNAKDYARKLGQKKVLEFLEKEGAKHNLYKDDKVEKKNEFSLKNREKPSEDMGFDSI